VQLVGGAHWRARGDVAGAQEVDTVRPRSRRTRSGAARSLDGVGAGAEHVGADRAGGAMAQAASDASGLVRGAGDVGVEQGSGHSRQSSSVPSEWRERARDGARKLTVWVGVGRNTRGGRWRRGWRAREWLSRGRSRPRCREHAWRRVGVNQTGETGDTGRLGWSTDTGSQRGCGRCEHAGGATRARQSRAARS
jgi:hypothetical protein